MERFARALPLLEDDKPFALLMIESGIRMAEVERAT